MGNLYEKIMEICNNKKIEKQKLILLIFSGILLIGLTYFESVGQESKSKDEKVQEQENENSYENKITNKIKNMVESIDGISGTKVMVTFSCGTEKIVKEDTDSSTNNDGSGTNRKTTVILNKDDGDNPYVIKEIYPRIQGVAITASGDELKYKKQEIINMISALFDVPVHKITIIENN